MKKARNEEKMWRIGLRTEITIFSGGSDIEKKYRVCVSLSAYHRVIMVELNKSERNFYPLRKRSDHYTMAYNDDYFNAEFSI